MSEEDRRMSTSARSAPPGATHVKVYQGGTVWSAGALLVSLFASFRMWTLVPGALERFAFPVCRATTSSVQLNWIQVGVVAVGGVAAIVLAEYGTRRQGNKWLGMIASVIGVSCVIGAGAIGFTLVSTPLSCTS